MDCHPTQRNQCGGCYARVAGIKTGGLAVADIIGGVASQEPCLLASLLMHASMPTANYVPYPITVLGVGSKNVREYVLLKACLPLVILTSRSCYHSC